MEDPKGKDFIVRMPETKTRGRPSQPKSRRISISVSKVAIPVSQITHNPAVSIIAYCLASISMTVTNKYCVSGPEWNMNFFLLAFQASFLFVLRSPSNHAAVHDLHTGDSYLQIIWDDKLPISIFIY
jgi:hypothetical protein